jgi:6-pyruvoyltetrahydropterin/6-carboxytetrahydropterin synthase
VTPAHATGIHATDPGATTAGTELAESGRLDAAVVRGETRRKDTSMRVTGTFQFEAAHNLTLYKGGPEPLHGHTWRLEVSLEGPVRADGMVFDFVELKRIVEERVLSRVRNRYLNELIPNPSTELLAAWVWHAIEKDLPLLDEVKIWEGPESNVAFRRTDLARGAPLE